MRQQFIVDIYFTSKKRTITEVQEAIMEKFLDAQVDVSEVNLL